MRTSSLFALLTLAACSTQPPAPAPAPVAVPEVTIAPPPAPARPETVTVNLRDPNLDREIAQLRMSLLERSAQLAESDRRLEEATTEVVRAMARLRSLATRAEAASAIAEAEVTLQQLKGRVGSAPAPEVRQAEASLRASSTAFDAENFAGSVYLASQAKRVASAGRGRLAEAGAGPRAGERAFSVPVAIITNTRANLREGPSTATSVVATVDAGTAMTAFAYAQDWIRVTLSDGRGAWVHQGLVKGVAPGAP